MKNIKRVIAIFGMPRSGTSFLGQIIDSCPNVAYRLEPIFSYKLKNIVDENSTKEQYQDFFLQAFESDDDEFMNQVEKRQKGYYPTFNKDKIDILAFKTTRFHQILPTLLEHFNQDELKVISLVRHPAGAICSWINHPNEFPEGCDYKQEWRSGQCRKTAKEEFWGFEDWKKVMGQHIDLESQYKNFRIFQYEDVVRNIEQETREMFDFAELPFTEQTRKFLLDSQNKNIDDPYAVYKNKNVVSKWKNNLDVSIQNEIINDIEGTPLERFLVD